MPPAARPLRNKDLGSSAAGVWKSGQPGPAGVSVVGGTLLPLGGAVGPLKGTKHPRTVLCRAETLLHNLLFS